MIGNPTQATAHRPSTGRLIAALTTLMLIGQLLFAAAPASADPDPVLFDRWLGHYAVAATGNTLRTAASDVDACSVSNGSSAALVGLPASGTISAAYLYWAGSHSGAAGVGPDYQVTFEGVPTAADRTYTDTFTLDTGTDILVFDWFSGVADVTSIVQASGNTTYDFADLSVYTGEPHCASSGVVSGWSLIVIYSDPALDDRAINLYEGFSLERYSSNTYTLSDFTAPPSATGDITVLAWEGDAALGLAGEESLTFNGDLLSDSSLNSAPDDPYNSTNTFTNNAASYGVDLDRFNVDASISAGDTTAQLGLSAGQDLVLLSAVVLAVDTYGADLSLDKAIDDATPEPGETVTYTISVSNSGVDEATGVVVADLLPSGMDYVSHAASAGSYNEATGVWTVGSIAGPAEPDPTPGIATLEIAAQVTAAIGSTVTNSAEIIAVDQTDPNSRPNNGDPGEDDQDSVSFTVNAPPDAVDDTDTTDEDTPVTVSVLGNDSDVDGTLDPLSVTVTTGPLNGTAVAQTDGTVLYTPAPNYHGTDTFDYEVCDDDGECDTATVTITVTDVNDPPVAVDDADTTDEDTPVSVSVLTNDSDVEGDTLIVTGVTDPANGSVVVNADGTITYTPDADFHGTDAFDYTISDGNGGTDTATVDITVDPINDPPIAVDDADTTDEDTTVTVDVLGNDTDVDGTLDPSSVAITGAPSNGGVLVNADGSIDYTPALNFHGVDTFTYQVCDDEGGLQGAVDFDVLGLQNGAPDGLALVDAGGVVVEFLSYEGSFTAVGGPADGMTSTDVGVSESGSTPVGESLQLIGGIWTGPAAESRGVLNTAPPPPATSVFVSEFHYDNAGSDSGEFVEVTGDAGGDLAGWSIVLYNGNGGAPYGTVALAGVIDDEDGACDTAIVTITVNPINDPPVAVDDADTTDEDTPVTVDVLDNDSDVDGDTLTVTNATDPANGSVVINADGTITYTPDPDFNGIDSFDYTISDGNGGTDTATVDITVDPINDGPVANDDAGTTDEDTPVTVSVLGNDTDVEGDTLTVTGVTDPANGSVVVNAGGTITYFPDADFNGIDSFDYTISDGNGGTDTATVTVTVADVNDPPVADDDTDTTDEDTTVAVDVLGNDSDVDGTLDPSSVAITGAPSNGGVFVNADGSIDYTPAVNFHGVDTFDYEVCDDDGECDTATVTVTVTDVNDPPVADDDTDTTDEDTPVTVPVLANDSDVDGTLDPSSVTVTTGPSNGTAVPQADGTVLYTPALNFHGVDTFDYEVCDDDGECDTATVTITVADVNDPPVADDDTDTTDEDTTVAVDVLGNDSDVDGTLDPSSVAITGAPSNGGVFVNADGSIDYTPAVNFHGVDTFDYEVCDDDGECDTATVTITVNPINDPPVADDDTDTTDEDTQVTVPVLDNDTDIDGDPLTVTGATDPANGSVVVNADGTITYTPDADFNGIDSFDYTISDGNGGADTATVTITVGALNDPPTATTDSDTTDEDTPVTVSVLDNDSDVDGDTLTVTDATDPANGSVVINADGTITYTPDPDFNGTDTFDYQVCDPDNACDTATVDITVNPINDPPVASDDVDTTDEDTPVTVSVLDNDSDVDGDTLTVTDATDPANGSVVINADGTITYTPDPDFNGTDTFDYTISDGNGGTDTATVDITVNPINDPPVASDDVDTTDEDTPVTVSVLDNDSDVDGDTLTVTGATDPANGSIVVNADGTITYTPDPDFNGTDTFDYTISDGNGGTDTATVDITVNPINDPPVASDDVDTTDEDTPVTVPVLANDSDVDGTLDPSSVTVTTGPSNGTAVPQADGTVLYTPAVNFHGVDTFDYEVCDDDGECDTATVTITVNPINDPPVADDDTDTTDEDTTVAVDVLGNDSDVDGTLDPSSVAITGAPSNGGVFVNADGSIDYTPAVNFHGVDTFDYEVCDDDGECDTATVTVTVTDVNDPPVADDDTDTTDEDTPVTVPVLANDSDVDGTLDPSSVTVTTGPSNGTAVPQADGTVLYTPAVNFHGVDTFDYEVCDDDGECDTATVTISVADVNDPPVADDDTDTTDEDTQVTVPVLDNDTDIDGDPLTVTGATDPANGSVVVNADGTITYTPDADFNGIDSFDYTISDGNGGTDTATVIVTVLPANDPPVATNDSDTTDEDTPVTVAVLDNDTDIDGDTLTVTDATDPANGSIVVNADGTITYTPNADFNGTDTFTYQVCDPDNACDTATVEITINPINDGPVATNDSDTTDEDTPVAIPILGNDSDPDGDTLTVTDATDPANGSVVINADGTITYTPGADFNGIDTFDYTISDGNGGTDTATVIVTVLPANDPPVAGDDLDSTLEETPVTVSVLDNDSDVDGDTLTVTDATDPANGSVVVNADGTITYTPDPDFHGDDTFDYTISDGNGGTDTATVDITVNPINDPPVASDDVDTTDEDTPVTVSVLDNDTDVDGDTLTVTNATDPANGSVVINADGTITYTPDPDFNGTDTFTYQVCDPDNACDTATVDITINPINDPPVANDDIDTTDEDTPVTVSVLDNDSDVDGTIIPSTVTVTTGPSNGTAVPQADGTVLYTPALNFHGVDTFDYEVCDNDGECDTATVDITINPINDPPVASDDVDTTDEDTPVTVSVLDNDSDVDGDTLTVTNATDPANGSVVINADGTITYTPDPDFNGTDTFDYQVCDPDNACDTATVDITINPINDDPVANDDIDTTRQDTALTVQAPGVLANDSDPEGDALTVTDATDPANGSVTVNADGSFTYVPDPGYFGLDSFDYTISDGNSGTDTATVDITINPFVAPIAVDDSWTTSEDTPLTVPAPGVLGNDSDPDGDPLAVADVTDPPNGSIAINSDGSFTYTPDADFHGVDTFTYQACDTTGLCHTALVMITVDPANDPPVAGDDLDSTLEETPVTVSVLDNDSDVDGDTLTVTDATDPANGSVVVNADGTITYTPDPDFHGDDTFDYTISDGNGGTDTATVDITVNPINDPPVASDDVDTTDEDTPVTVSVLDNDTDVDGDTLTVTNATDPANGSVVINADGTITYTPDPDFNGTDTFTYQVCDPDNACDTATVDITINPINDPPVANDDIDTTDEDTPVTVSVLDNDSDVDGTIIPSTVTVTTGPSNGTAVPQADGTVLYTPALNFHGVDTFDYEVCDNDGECDTATVDITVNPINDPPVASDDVDTTDEDTPVTVSVLDNDSDVDGDTLTVTNATDPANGSVVINADGTITYTPDPDFNGTDTFDYTISDGNGVTDTATVDITINPINDDPVANDDADTTDEDTPVTVSVLDNDTDVDGDTLTVTNATDPANGSVVINADGTITYTPDPDFNGTDTFDYTISDGNGGTDTATVTVTVNPINDPPIATDDGTGTDEDTPVTIPVLDNDSDVDGDTLTVTNATDPANGSVVINADGTITYTPDPDFNGTDTFTYQVCDPDNACDTATVTVTVNPINDGPVAADDADTTPEDTPVAIVVLDNDTDIDGDGLAVTITADPANGTATVNADGTITYTPATGFVGVDTFAYTISDGNGGTDTATVTVTVTSVNRPPTFTDDPTNSSQTTTVGGSLVALQGSDPDGDPYTFSVSGGSLPPGVSLNPDGTFSGSPSATGTYNSTILICDVHMLCTTETLTIQVQAQELPKTGMDITTLTVFAAFMILIGAVLIVGPRRRDEHGE